MFIPDALTTAAVDAQIASALLATNLVRVLRCRFYVASLPAFTASGSGVGKTLTANANGALSADSNTPSVGDRILYPASSAHAGVYSVTTVGSAGTPWVLTRATDFDDDADVLSNMVVQVTEGSTYADTSWQLTTNDPITVDTTSLSWSSYMPNANTSLTLRGLTLTGSAAELSLAGNLFLTVNSPSEITSNQSAYTLTDGYTHYRLSTDASRTIYGISGSNNKVALIENIGSNNLVLANESGSAGAASQRILTGTGSDLTLATNQCAIIIYDPTSSRWRVLASTATPAAASLSDPTTIGTAKLGTWPDNSAFAYLAHKDVSSTLTKYAIIQNSSGDTYLNATSTAYHRIGNATVVETTTDGMNAASGKKFRHNNTDLAEVPEVYFPSPAEGGTVTLQNSRVHELTICNITSTLTAVSFTAPASPVTGQIQEISSRAAITTATFTASHTILGGSTATIPAGGPGPAWYFNGTYWWKFR